MKYKVVIPAMFINGVKYRRGDIVETEEDLGTRVEPYVEVIKEEKPKRRRRTKAEMEATIDEQDS